MLCHETLGLLLSSSLCFYFPVPPPPTATLCQHSSRTWKKYKVGYRWSVVLHVSHLNSPGRKGLSIKCLYEPQMVMRLRHLAFSFHSLSANVTYLVKYLSGPATFQNCHSPSIFSHNSRVKINWGGRQVWIRNHQSTTSKEMQVHWLQL